ncbi:MAG: flagellar basal-body rod protein FlgG [Planctomycetes bacterium]|nr:flagellar basal-body rod protein FlgG [Planctomycetota bacterium]
MPIRALSTASTGMTAMQTQVDVIANNLANVRTTGFKQDRANFTDLLYQEIQRAGVRLPGENLTPVGKAVGSGVRLASIDKEFSQGSLTLTGSDLDMAISGEGFFQVLLPSGAVAYTRDGSFQRDKDGNLVTGNGQLMQPAITLPGEASRFTISETGLIQAYSGAAEAPIATAQVEIARFINPKGMRAIGDNLFLATEASGQPETGTPGSANFGTIVPQALEESNVEIVREMVDLISAQRAYEINSNAIKTSDEMLRVANGLRA